MFVYARCFSFRVRFRRGCHRSEGERFGGCAALPMFSDSIHIFVEMCSYHSLWVVVAAPVVLWLVWFRFPRLGAEGTYLIQVNQIEGLFSSFK